MTFEDWYAQSGLQDYYIGVEEMNEVWDAAYRAGYLAALEDAAKVCDEQGRHAGDGMTFYTATGQCAKAILALKEKAP